MKVWKHIATLLKTTGSCALVTVSGAGGSTPRERGARMIVDGNGRFFGTIGGGQLEFEAIRLAATKAATRTPSFEVRSVSLGPDLGQCCGGRIELAIEVLSRNSLKVAEELSALEAQNARFATKTDLEHGNPSGKTILKTFEGEPVKIIESENDSQHIVEVFGQSHRQLFLFGAGHVGKALVLSLAPLPFDVTWVDSRADQFPQRVPANVQMICTSNPAAVLLDAPEQAFVLAMTHSHALDEEIMARALVLQKFAYCGVIGSKTKKARFERRLKSRGVDSSLLSKMNCPVGATSIQSKHPAAIAAGITVDLLERDEACFQQAASGESLAQQ